MTSEKAQIQALINDIDEVLNKDSPRLPWVMSNEAMQQRQVLEQTRQYLTTLQQQLEDDRPIPAGIFASGSPASQSASESAEQVLQAVLQEMNYWRVNMLQPLRNEVDTLQRQREGLTQEIRQLEAERQQYGLPHQPNQQLLIEFLQSAMAQMQANLSGQVTEMIANLAAQPSPSFALQDATQSDAQNLAALTPAGRLAQMQKMQAQSDQLMLKLDSTLQIIFESLNRNVQTYQESLEQGLNRMHGLGQQGEAMFAFLVNRLAQQLGREASSVLQSSDRQATQPSLPATDSEKASANFTVADFLSPLQSPAPAAPAPAAPFNLSEEVLDISELDVTEEPLADNLAALDLELSRLELSPLPDSPAEPFDLFSGDQPLPRAEVEAGYAEVEDWQSTQSPTVNDLDSALDLLNQLNVEMQAEGLIAPANTAPSTELVGLAAEPALIATPDALYDDAFYLYDDARKGDEGASVPVPQPTNADSTKQAETSTLEQEWFGGLADPAIQPEMQAALEPASSSQRLETFSPNPTPFSALAPESTRFAEPSLALDLRGQVEASEASEPVETITSLTELIPDITSEAAIPAASIAVDIQALAEEEALQIAEAPIEDVHVDLGMRVDSPDHRETEQSLDDSSDLKKN